MKIWICVNIRIALSSSNFLKVIKFSAISSSDLYRFSPTGLMPPHPGLSPHAHALASHALVSSAPKTDHSTLDHNHRFVSIDVSATPTSIPSNQIPNILSPSITFPLFLFHVHNVHENINIDPFLELTRWNNPLLPSTDRKDVLLDSLLQ